MAEYSFRLPDVRISVTSSDDGEPRFVAAVVSVRDCNALGEGVDSTEAGAVGRAILAARQAFEECEGCGRPFYRDELEEDEHGLLVCGDCWGVM